ncbi:MAG: hypothetical protein WC401_05545 [Bacteroidales bacterium]
MKNFTKLVFVFIIVGATSIHTVQSQEFSISGSSNNSISGGVAFDGTSERAVSFRHTRLTPRHAAAPVRYNALKKQKICQDKLD